MSETKEPRDADIKEASSRLNEGLEACRSIMSNYRAMLTGEQSSDHSRPENSEDGGGR